ncbi:MAG: hypothetical protein OEY23_22945 [Acidimicrobiia bacterium]|nr:hypothetical protein [Acidimicrobiia bacterium]
MFDVLVALGIVVVLMVVAAVGALAAVWIAARRRNRVHPSAGNVAPLGWLVSPSAAARLHRRLRAAVAAGQAGRLGPELGPLRAQLHAEAVAVDRQLVATARLARSARTAPLADAARRTSLIEGHTARLLQLAHDDRGAVTEDRLAAIDERLSALDLARAEVAEAELGWTAPSEEDRPARPSPGRRTG